MEGGCYTLEGALRDGRRGGAVQNDVAQHWTLLEGRAANLLQGCRQLYVSQRGALVEGVAADAGDCYGELHGGQRTAPLEGIVADAEQGGGQVDAVQGKAALEGLGTDLLGGGGQRDAVQAGAVAEQFAGDFVNEAADIGRSQLTADDEGKAKTETDYKLRARQNVIFEMGYFFGLLSRSHVFLLLDDDVEKPSDLSGIVYNSLKEDWKTKLFKELQACGYNVDPNDLLI